MTYSGRDRRRSELAGPRAPFSELGAAAIRERIQEARAHDASWGSSRNLAWVRWPTEDGRYLYCALRRSIDFLTGELGVSPVPVELDDLPLIDSLDEAMPAGCRIRLGHMLQGHDRWWSSGGTEATLIWRLGWIVQQMRYRMKSFIDATQPPA